MYLLTVVAETNEQNPEHGRVGEAHVACWIERDTAQEAIAVAHAMIEADGWNVLRNEQVAVVTDADYEDDEQFGPFYEQALIDKEVININYHPRFPVYYMDFKISPNSDGDAADEARVWVCNERVSDGHDPFEPDFWSGDRVERAISQATNAIAEHGYAVDELVEQYPCICDESSEDFQYYDDAEDCGLCLVLVHDEPD